MSRIYNDITETVGDTPLVRPQRTATEQGVAALQVAKRTENKGETVVAVTPSAAERYLSTWLFADIGADVDDISGLLSQT